MTDYTAERIAEIKGMPAVTTTPISQAVIATTPGGMMEAQGQLIEWINEKLATVRTELGVASALLTQIQEAEMNVGHAKRNIQVFKRRQAFYEKIKTALEAGYYIIPPFDCQIFALRTDRASPSEDVGRHPNPRNDAKVPTLPAGEGDYVHPVPAREWSHSNERKATNGTEVVCDDYYRNNAWNEVEFPVKAMKPELLAATVKAMGLKVFDALGIMPQYRAADPIIVGTIKHYKQYHAPVTFFVAWWLDRDDL